jgi:hypothetical protein
MKELHTLPESEHSMRRDLLAFLGGTVVAVAAQTFVAIAETWSFGPSLRPLTLVLGPATFPVVTAVSLGIPIGFMFFAAAKLLRAEATSQVLALLAPFALLQLVGLLAGNLNAYAFFYTAAYVGMAAVGAILRRHRGDVFARGRSGT